MPSELDTLRGWVEPYALLKGAVVVLAKSLRPPLKHALVLSGPVLPLAVRFDEPADDEPTTRRIFVEPDESIAGDESVRVRMIDIASDDEQARTIVWNGDSQRATSEVIDAIRELAGLDAA